MTDTNNSMRRARSVYQVVMGLLASITLAPAQEPATILEVQVDNIVAYRDDIADPSRLASSPNVAPAATRTFMRWIAIGDIISVNGKPAKGVEVGQGNVITLRTSPVPSQSIADTVRSDIHDFRFEIQQPDGIPIGTIVASGLSFGSPPPGAPRKAAAGNNAITGGTGAFLGATGQLANVSASPRIASMLEDPANRRTNGGGPILFILHVIPMRRPEIVMTSVGPAVFHADFSLVTAATPARAGEVLIIQATGLGPTVPGVDPGQPFPTDALQQVNSPVDLTVNGRSGEVINKVGWPGLADTYRIDFRVPDGIAAGTARIQVTAAWIAGRPVNIPIQ